MFLVSVTQFWSDWGLRISVLVSLAAYALLGLLSWTRRRRSASGGPWILQWALGAILWTFYQFAEIAATNALGNLSLSGADASGEEEQEQQLTTFWAPFLLHHGGPDNLTAYALEDNLLSLRKMVEMALQLLGVMYAIWKNYIYRGYNSGVLFAASAVVFVEGAARYVERACALWRANLDNMQEQDDSSKKPAEPASGSSSTSSAGASSSSRQRSSSSRAAAVESTISRYEGQAVDDGEALFLAQDLFQVWRRFLVDSSVHQRSPWQRASEKLLSLRWSSMCKLEEMELSLMYEVLYTKATVAHTWPSYLNRFMSPVCTGAAALLFWLHRDHGRPIAASFGGITYLLLGAAFALDVVWLLRALGSTWTYAFLKTTNKLPRRPWAAWFAHQTLFAEWWLRLHRAVVYVDPLRLFGIDPVAYRLWSGTIGRYNLLRECTAPRHPWRRWLTTKLGLQDNKYLSELPAGVKQRLFERVQRILPTAGNDNPAPRRAPRPDGGDPYTMVDITTCWGKVALARGAYLFRGRGPILGREFEQDVLVWHIATCIFFSRAMVRKVANSSIHATAIEAMSEYLMFLVAERRQMLPGLVLHSQLEETRTALEERWDGREGTTTSAAGGHEDDKAKLAWLVRQKRNHDRSWLETEGSRRLVLDAAEVAGALTKGSTRQRQVVPMLGLIFNVWVDKLLYAAVRCSRESHAKQLSRGGELITVL